jgi:DNA mismatch repair protein MutS2
VAAMAPLFKLEQGLPGNSFAFELARKIGLPEDIIKVAEEKAGNDFVDMERQLRKIARNRRALDEKLNRVRTADKTLEGLTERYEKELNEVKRLKKSIIDDAKSQAAEIISGANREIERTIKEIKEAQAEKERTKIVRRELQNYVESSVAAQSDENDRKIDRKMEQILARKERERKRKEERAAKGTTTTTANVAAKPIKEEPLKVGDKVRVKESDLIGEVTQILGKNISIAIGAITSKMSLNKVERISNQEFKESSRKASTFAQSRSNIYSNADITDRKLNFSPSIDIRGERLNDAIDIVMHFMDDALMVGIGQVKILHGKGNGVLREEIRKYIRTLPGIKSIRDEAIEQGGAGITVIDFE